jgi:hypothetical protein
MTTPPPRQPAALAVNRERLALPRQLGDNVCERPA